MNATTGNGLPKSFWIIGVCALFWNLLGMLAFIAHVSTDPAALPGAERAYLEAYPAWGTSAFAIAVTAGVVGAAVMLLKRAWAVPLFATSLVAALIQDLASFVATDAMALYGTGAAIMPVAVAVIGLALVWYSNSARSRGWLR